MRRLRRHHQLMWGFSRSLLASLRRPVFVYLITLAFTIMGVFSLVYWVLEGPNHREPLSWFDSLYFVVTVMSGVGLGDIAPVSMLGKALTMAMMLGGTAIFVSFTAVLAVSILEIELEHRDPDSKP